MGSKTIGTVAMGDEDLNAVLDALPMPAFLIGPAERIHLANRAAVALLGAGLVGRHYVSALRQPGLLDTIEAVARDGTRREVAYLSTEGMHDTTWRVSVAAVPAGLLAVFEDTTLIEQAGQIRRDFVANVSHELRSPLTALQGFIETLRGAARHDAVARDRFLAIMEREADRMNRLIRDLLSLSRVEAEARLRPRTLVDAADVLRSVVSTQAPVAAERGVEILLDCGAGSGEVVADADQLAQVFTNLIENGMKYGGGHVTITLTEETHVATLRGPALRIDVSDRGDGIDAIHLPRLTERFYRVDGHRAREMGGTGLGLAIVKHIVGRHRGLLRIHSELGVGSRFSVILPRPVADAAGRTSGPAKAPDGSAQFKAI